MDQEHRRGGVAWPSAAATTRLRGELSRLRPGRFYQADVAGISVLSVCHGLTVWCVEGVFVWRVAGQGYVHHAADPVRAARAVLDSYRSGR